MAFCDVTGVFDDAGNLKPFSAWTDEQLSRSAPPRWLGDPPTRQGGPHPRTTHRGPEGCTETPSQAEGLQAEAAYGTDRAYGDVRV